MRSAMTALIPATLAVVVGGVASAQNSANATAQAAAQPAAQAVTLPEPAVRRSGSHSGIGTSRMNIDLVSDPVRYRLPGDITGPITVQPHPRPVQGPRPGRTPIIIKPGVGVVVDGSGLSVNGRYDGGKWNVGFHLGSGYAYRYPVVTTPWCGYPLFGWRRYHYGVYGNYAGYYGYNPWGSFYDYYGQARAVGYGQGAADPRLWWQPGQAAQPAEPPEPPTTLELAANAIDNRESKEAVRLVRQHLDSEPSDVSSQRLLAVALINDARFEDGIAVMRQAYRTDPALASEPIKPRELGLTEQDWRSLLGRTVTFAHRTDSAAAWLTVAAFMQAESRTDVAMGMIRRAENKGLERDMVDRFAAALGE